MLFMTPQSKCPCMKLHKRSLPITGITDSPITLKKSTLFRSCVQLHHIFSYLFLEFTETVLQQINLKILNIKLQRILKPSELLV
ncbi:hypothetical protein JTE90_013558 [Oedothorax gibbosus]|uniref:Uncharacterized protein n=1 Tax=Oedothorax gibbosus TaxID=931172 RepID=A0AAV6UC24_9ARAC|nr:hypothetical protein JTE90_013558 [Oedothorax gibbosus]